MENDKQWNENWKRSKTNLPYKLGDALVAKNGYGRQKTQLLLIEGDSERGIAERIQQTNPAKFGVFPVTGKLNNANGKPKL